MKISSKSFRLIIIPIFTKIWSASYELNVSIYSKHFFYGKLGQLQNNEKKNQVKSRTPKSYLHTPTKRLMVINTYDAYN